jgi:acetoin:2,6-dichlorophenolindophenol oxidoreductase subunit alpha
LQGQGRLNAHRGSCHGKLGGECHRGRVCGDCDWSRILCKARRQRSGGSLPVIYVCENNLYTEYTHFSETTAGDVLARGKAFGVHSESVDGQDVRAVYAAAGRLVERARTGGGPAFLVCNTYRYTGHHVGDINREYYRSKQEEQEWKTKRDPIQLFADWLTAEKLADTAKLNCIEADVRARMQAAVDFAISAPYPNPMEAEQDVYA